MGVLINAELGNGSPKVGAHGRPQLIQQHLVLDASGLFVQLPLIHKEIEVMFVHVRPGSSGRGLQSTFTMALAEGGDWVDSLDMQL